MRCRDLTRRSRTRRRQFHNWLMMLFFSAYPTTWRGRFISRIRTVVCSVRRLCTFWFSSLIVHPRGVQPSNVWPLCGAVPRYAHVNVPTRISGVCGPRVFSYKRGRPGLRRPIRDNDGESIHYWLFNSSLIFYFKDAFSALQNDVFPTRVMAEIYSQDEDYQNVINLSEVGLELVRRIELNTTKALGQ